MLPGALTLRAERGHRSLPVGVEVVPPLRALSLFRREDSYTSVKWCPRASESSSLSMLTCHWQFIEQLYTLLE